MSGALRAVEVVIANAGTVSTAADIDGYELVGVVLPAAFTGVTLTFQAAADYTPPSALGGGIAAGGTFRTVALSSGALSVTAAPGLHIILDRALFSGLGRAVKVVSGAAEAAQRTVLLLLRPTIAG